MYNTLNNPSAHPSYSHYYLLSPSALFFFFAHLIVFLHILLFFAHPIVFFAHLIVLLWERYANAAMMRERVSKSWIPKSQTRGTPSLPSRTRVKNPSSGKLKARRHRLAHQSMALGVEVSESDSLD